MILKDIRITSFQLTPKKVKESNLTFFKYKNIYETLRVKITDLNTLPYSDAEAIFNSVVDLICILLDQLTKSILQSLGIMHKLGYWKKHSSILSTEHEQLALSIVSLIHPVFDDTINSELKIYI